MVHWDSTRGEVPAVVGRRPGTAGPGICSKSELSSRIPDPAVCALEERRPRHCSFLRLEDLCPPSKHERGQAEPTRRRRGVREIARRRRTLAPGVDVLSPGGRRSPDRRLFRRQTPICPIRCSGIFFCLSAFICVICGYLRCLRVFVSSCLRCVRWLCARTLCLCASVVQPCAAVIANEPRPAI